MTRRTHTVNGRQYEVWANFNDRAMYAQAVGETEIKRIHGGGYISNELTVRKAIARAYKLPTFRK